MHQTSGNFKYVFCLSDVCNSKTIVPCDLCLVASDHVKEMEQYCSGLLLSKNCPCHLIVVVFSSVSAHVLLCTWCRRLSKLKSSQWYFLSFVTLFVVDLTWELLGQSQTARNGRIFSGSSCSKESNVVLIQGHLTRKRPKPVQRLFSGYSHTQKKT